MYPLIHPEIPNDSLLSAGNCDDSRKTNDGGPPQSSQLHWLNTKECSRKVASYMSENTP